MTTEQIFKIGSRHGSLHNGKVNEPINFNIIKDSIIFRVCSRIYTFGKEWEAKRAERDLIEFNRDAWVEQYVTGLHRKFGIKDITFNYDCSNPRYSGTVYGLEPWKPFSIEDLLSRLN